MSDQKLIKTQFQKSVTKIISRKNINFAFYNPRKISDSARKELKAFLKKDSRLCMKTFFINFGESFKKMESQNMLYHDFKIFLEEENARFDLYGLNLVGKKNRSYFSTK